MRRLTRCEEMQYLEAKETQIEFANEQRRQFFAHNPFDSKGEITYGFHRLKEIICDDKSPCCGLVRLYAKLGLHCYNFLQGENYQLHCVKKYNHRTIFVAVSYFITMDAMDPATSLLQTVQTEVAERSYTRTLVSFNVARLRAENKILPKQKEIEFSFEKDMLEWPTLNPFRNRKRYYMVKNSELENNKWIRLYLELAVATTNKRTNYPKLSNLKIVKVAIEDSSQDENERLKAKNVVLFISYRDNFKARVGKDVDRILLVRRNYNDQTGVFNVVGDDKSSEFITKKWRNHQSAKRFYSRRLGILNPWRLSSPRWRNAYKIRKC